MRFVDAGFGDGSRGRKEGGRNCPLRCRWNAHSGQKGTVHDVVRYFGLMGSISHWIFLLRSDLQCNAKQRSAASVLVGNAAF